MRNYKSFWVALFWTMGISFLNAQDISFKLNHNESENIYEVFAVPNITNSKYFVGGGSQISIVLPQDIADQPLNITTVNGGFWTDNSKVYAPSGDHTHDFHGIASNGSIVSFTAGEPLLLFTFELPNGECRSDVRLFNNNTDADHQVSGMKGSDFKNFFASIAVPYKNDWLVNENVTNNSCAAAPTVASDALTVDQDESGSICLTIEDLNVEDYFNVAICESIASSQNGASIVTVSGNTLCLEYTPNEGYSGLDEVCIDVCDQTGLCNTAFVAITVVPEVVYSTISATAANCENNLDWTIAQPDQFSRFELQRSFDGVNYELLEAFESTNQSTDLQFNFKDTQVVEDFFYRLKLVFHNEEHQYTEAVFVTNDCDDSSYYATVIAESNNCSNNIQWNFNNITTISGYQLQRSDEGSNFEVLQTYDDFDFTSFDYIDREASGDHYYRLKIFFLDGTAIVTNNVFVKSDCLIKEGDFALYPNPASHHTEIINIKYFADTENTDLMLTDPLGRVVRRLDLKVSLGINIIKLDVSKLPSGTYFVSLEGKEIITKSFVKLDEF